MGGEERVNPTGRWDGFFTQSLAVSPIRDFVAGLETTSASDFHGKVKGCKGKRCRRTVDLGESFLSSPSWDGRGAMPHYGNVLALLYILEKK